MDVGLAGLCCTPKWSGNPQRIYICTVVCILSIGQTLILNSWSPIIQIAEQVFHWNDGTVALIQTWFPVMLFISSFPLAYLVLTKGLRPAILLGALVLAIGSGLRAIPVANDFSFTILCNVGTALVGLSVAIFPGCSTAVASNWFPAEQRATATAAIISATILGGAVSFLLDTAVVYIAPLNLTLSANETNAANSSLDGDLTWRLEAHYQIMLLMLIQFIVLFIGWLPTIIYFPEKPDDAPSVSSTVARTEFSKGLCALIRLSDFWILAISFALVFGVLTTWLPVLGIAFRSLNVSVEAISWIGFSGTVMSVPFLILSSWVGQQYRCMKLVIIFMLSGSTFMFLIYGLICDGVIPANVYAIGITVVMGTASAFGCASLFLELTCECCYPIHENLCTVTVVFGSAFASIIFYVPIMAAPNTAFEQQWVSWAPFVSSAGSLLAIIFLKEAYNRLNVDQNVSDESTRLLDDQDGKEREVGFSKPPETDL